MHGESPDEAKRNEERARIDKEKEEKIREAEMLMEKMQINGRSAVLPGVTEPGSIQFASYKVQSNVFGVRITKPNAIIYKYDVDIHSYLGKKMVEFSKKGKVDHTVVDRKKKCVSTFKKAIVRASFYKDDATYFYDGQSLMYTMEKLEFSNSGKACETVILEGKEVGEDLSPFEYINFVVKPCDDTNEILLSDIRKTDRNLEGGDRSAMQFVDVVTSMSALFDDNDRFTVFHHGKIFSNRPEMENLRTVDLGEGKTLYPGVTKSLKLIEGPKGRKNASPAIAIDSLKAAFHNKQKLIDKAELIVQNINRQLSPIEIDKISQQVRGLGCTTNHTKRPRNVEIHGISRDSANSKKMEIETGGTTTTVTVAEYFKMKYERDLKYGDAPLAMSRERGQMNLYPMELLDVTPMQRVTIPQTTGTQSQKTTKECAVAPSYRQVAIMDQTRLLDLTNAENKHLCAAGLGIVARPLSVDGRHLPAPALKYGSNAEVKPDPNVAKWKPPGRNYKFINPAECAVWAMYCLPAPKERISIQDVETFGKEMIGVCRARGMNVAYPVECGILEGDGHKSLEVIAREKMRAAAQHNCQFVFFITNENITIHKHLKLEERYTNMVTQDLKTKTMMNFLTKKQFQTMDNIVAKMNLKLGGLNYSISIGHVTNGYDAFPASRLFVGIGITHAPPQGLTETLHGKGVAPSVVGFAANMGENPSEIMGDYIYQDPRKEELLYCIPEMFKSIIERYRGIVNGDGEKHEAKRPLPKEVIIYRQGVSEGSYAMVMRVEVPLIRAVLHDLGAKDVKITFIVVQKEHNIRLMPMTIDSSQSPTSQNIPSGVVVDQQLTHPNYKEFFLNSHLTLQGSARTPRYTILCDDIKFSMNEIEMVTHSLAYNFQIVNSPVSIPAPLYIANRYAERGASMFLAKTTDEMATSEQRQKTDIKDVNNELRYHNSKIGGQRINA